MPEKTLPPKITAIQFCRACLLFFGLAPGEVASLFHRRSLPRLDEVASVAERMADLITPDPSTLPAHMRLTEVADWAKAQAKA